MAKAGEPAPAGDAGGGAAAPAAAHAAHHAPHAHPALQAQHLAPSPELARLKELAAAGRAKTAPHARGVALFGGLLFAAGAAPGALPAAFVLFAATALPWRCVDFWRRRWAFFLIDFCYFVNFTVAAFLLLAPGDARAEAVVYALADGPLAGALAAWQCAWVFGDSEHTTSVLMHLLPGLALFANRYFTPPALRGWRGLAACARRALAARSLAACGLGCGGGFAAPVPARPDNLWFWLVAAPLAYYLAWQLLYWFVVQILLRGFIKRGGYDTSYNCLARRAAKHDNIWNRLVRRGSIARRVSMYGLLQLAFTAIALTAFLPTYSSFHLALAYQVIKLWLPILYGSRHLCEKQPQRALRNALGFTQSGKRLNHHTTHSHGLVRMPSLQRAGSLQRSASLQRVASLQRLASLQRAGSQDAPPRRQGSEGGAQQQNGGHHGGEGGHSHDHANGHPLQHNGHEQQQQQQQWAAAAAAHDAAAGRANGAAVARAQGAAAGGQELRQRARGGGGGGDGAAAAGG
ncbi:MAG: hypothetical protein J3K34DRAFT_522153 [Monoraphidium minutum]|nr:MAG: hypothetical protein J3K34DRAFT_522153 [Monoraphidium minutum]